MRLLALVFAFSALVACSGSSDKTKTAPDTPTHTLIFMDKSVSVNVNREFISQKYQQAINEIVEQNTHQKGDKLEVYFVHENTAKARALTLTVRSAMEDVSQASPTDREAAQTSFELALQREKNTFRRKILTKLSEQNTSRSNQETDLLASIPVIARIAETGVNVRVYYLSDMVESVKAPSGDVPVARDFGKNPPSGRAQADEWAKIDAERLQQYSLSNVTVTMILPFEPTSSVKENNPAVTQYWQKLFEVLGTDSIEEQ